MTELLEEPRYSPALTVLLVIFGILILGIGILGFIPGVLEATKSYIAGHPTLGPIIYMLVVIFSIIVIPLNTAPIVPFGVGLWGIPAMTIFIMIGWMIGATIAFIIARYLGRPVLKHFISLKKLETYEKHIPENIEFVAVMLFRLAIPFDFVNYGIGLFSKISLKKYVLATFLGFIPMAFASSYVGKKLITGSYLIGFGLTALILLAGWSLFYFVLRRK